MAAMLSSTRALSGAVRPTTTKSAVRGASVVSRATAGGSRDVSAYDYACTLPGISAPFSDGPWDPAGFLNGARVKDVRRWRESEIVHGRVAMLASLGFLIQEQLQDSQLFFNFDGHISGPAIYQFQQVEARGAQFWEPLVLAIGLAESYRVALGWDTPRGEGFNSIKAVGEYDMGDLGFDPLGIKPKDEEELKIMETKELNNGRLAMIAIAIFVGQELLEQKEIFEHWFLDVEKEFIAEEVTVEKEVGILP